MPVVRVGNVPAAPAPSALGGSRGQEGEDAEEAEAEQGRRVGIEAEVGPSGRPRSAGRSGSPELDPSPRSGDAGRADVATVVEALDGATYLLAVPHLAALLIDAVEGGASVNFLAGVTHEQAAAWWTARAPRVADGTITPFVARRRGSRTSAAGPAIVGCALLIRSRNQNSPHRAEVGKVLVHRSLRRVGVGRALMEAVERRARAEGRWLLLLDTEAGSVADRFYRSMGWQVLGTMPNHAYRADGVLAPTTFFWKDLRS